jgi:mannose-6-phosphate isomerase-like protein (cupin superfamily)
VRQRRTDVGEKPAPAGRPHWLRSAGTTRNGIIPITAPPTLRGENAISGL